MEDITIQHQTGIATGTKVTQKSAGQNLAASFSEVLKGSLDQVNRLQHEADASITDLATGKKNDIHQTMIAMEKANVSFELLMQIRNKVISAYETIMRTPV
jgi:flagellar hook-basal body complex protein FliE